MLANIIAPLGHSKFVNDIKDLGQDITDVLKKDLDTLPADAAPKFAAGMLYGYTDGTVDKRDYILGCNHTGPYVRHQLNKAFEAYVAGDDAKGNKHMLKAEPFWRLSMVTCWKTNKYFTKMDHEKDAFLKRDDYADVVQANYEANKDYIIQIMPCFVVMKLHRPAVVWGFALQTW